MECNYEQAFAQDVDGCEQGLLKSYNYLRLE
jgi:hypothetical protein